MHISVAIGVSSDEKKAVRSWEFHHLDHILACERWMMDHSLINKEIKQNVFELSLAHRSTFLIYNKRQKVKQKCRET